MGQTLFRQLSQHSFNCTGGRREVTIEGGVTLGHPNELQAWIWLYIYPLSLHSDGIVGRLRLLRRFDAPLSSLLGHVLQFAVTVIHFPSSVQA